MKIFIQILFFISIAFLSYGQYEKDRYKVDSLQIFSGDKLTYEFNLHGPTQGLFFDRYVYSQLPYIQLKINNNTEDTITKRYREKDAHLMWIRVGGNCGRCDTMAPNDYFILQSGWAGWGYRPVGSFHTSIQIQTQIGDSIANSTIHTWGQIYPEGYSFDKVDVEQKVPENIDTIRIKEISVYDLSMDTLKALHYWNTYRKEEIHSIQVKYFTPYLAFDRHKRKENKIKYIDSLNNLIAPYKATIKSAEAGGMFIYCVPKNASQVSEILGKRELHIMTPDQRILLDRYRIEFKNEMTKEEIINIFEPFNIVPALIEGTHIAYIELTNSPEDNNNQITNQLAKIKEIKSIRQMTESIIVPMD